MISRSRPSECQHLSTSNNGRHYYLLDYQANKSYVVNTKYKLHLGSVSEIVQKYCELLPEQLYQDWPLETDWLIVPIRLHWLSRFKRRFDLNEIITKRLSSKIDNIQYLPAIKNVKASTQGNCQNKSARIANAKNKFRLRKSSRDKLQGSNVIIFDDVVATGSTMQACERLIKSADAKNIVWLSIAH